MNMRIWSLRLIFRLFHVSTLSANKTCYNNNIIINKRNIMNITFVLIFSSELSNRYLERKDQMDKLDSANGLEL